MIHELTKARALVRAAKQNLWPQLARNRNIAGAGFGRKVVGGRAPEGPAMVVYVVKKLARQVIPVSLQLPRKIYVGGECVDVDVVETGPFYTQSFTARERPAPSGISIAHLNVTAGTLGCVVNDNTDGSLCVLSNNHVLANANAGAVGDIVVQPGPADGGTTPGDDIGKLKRFIPVDCAATNRVDCAIASVSRADVDAAFKNGLMPYPSADHPAIGLLFAGGGGRTILNPIRDVMNMLNISFLAGANAIGNADIGMAVEKVGRTTEYTTGQVMEIDVTTSVGPYQCGDAQFDGQIATCTMGCPGDSGSLVCAGGKGECADLDCGCGTSSAAVNVFGLDISLDRMVEKEFRTRYLSRTRVGRYLIEVFFLNEGNILQRTHEATRDDKGAEHVKAGRHLYDKYADELRAAFLQPYRSELRLSKEHLTDIEQALNRAKPHMTPEENKAAHEALKIVRTAEGKNIREILELLDNEELLERAVQIVSSVPTWKKPGCDC